MSSNARLIEDDPEMGAKSGSKTKYSVEQKGPTVKCKVQLLDGSDLELEIDVSDKSLLLCFKDL